ncbi:MAG: dolichyl-diphosphooligosaccharide--protein glycosyltransferase subunit STT3 [archaeon]|nr:dolichyl-diphosphooligosaccharide--protein glycosyltransferase subunit STT3 [archaeon]
MNNENIKTITKSIIIILILMAVVFALRAPAADLNILDNNMKSMYVDDTGLPYFSEMDSYYNLRLTENFVDHGYAGDVMYDNGTQMDFHRLAPDGTEMNYEMGIVYVTSFFHSVANLFGDYSVKEVAFWTGAIVASLAVIPAFIFARRLTGTPGAIVATLIIALAPNYFGHTFPGFFDTDMFYYIFSLFFVFFFIEAMRTDNKALKTIFAILSFVSIGLFSLCWTGYIFYVALMGAFLVVYLLAKFILKIETEDKSKYTSRLKWIVADKDVLTIIFLFVLGLIILTIFGGLERVLNIFTTITNLLNIQSTGGAAGFPNVFISIGELQIPSALGKGLGSAFLANSNGVVNGIGGIAVLFAGLFGLYFILKKTFTLRKAEVKTEQRAKPKKVDRKAPSKLLDDEHKLSFSRKKIPIFETVEEIYTERHTNLIYACLFTLWIIVSLVAATRGTRFITTFVVPFALLSGMFVGYSINYIKSKNFKDYLCIAIAILGGFLIAFPFTQINIYLAVVIFLLLVILMVFLIYGLKDNKESLNFRKTLIIALLVFALITPTVCGAYVTANNVVPGTNDAMVNSMQWIHDNSPEDTIISSWWDFGYIFEYASDHQVTFDGGTQSGERAFWIGKAMATDNLDLSVGIFRMLNNGGTKAGTYMYDINHDNDLNTQILVHILPLSSSEARNSLIKDYHFTTAQADQIIKYTHPDNPRPTIFVASSDMLQKASWWAYFGSWDFKNQSSEHYSYYIPTKQLPLNESQSGNLTVIEDSVVRFNIIVNRGTNSTTAHTEAEFLNGTPVTINGTSYNPLEVGHMIVSENGKVVTNTTVPGASKNTNYTILVLGFTNTNVNNTNSSEMYYTPIVMSNELVNSMFTRLYLYGGVGQTQFTCLHTESGVSIWQVNYNSNSTSK